MIYPKKPVICLVCLGYVGLPLAFYFGKSGFKTSGYDINKKRINQLKKGFDSNGEFSRAELKTTKVEYSSSPQVISKANFLIITAPTPVDQANQPDLSPLLSVCKTVGKYLKKNSLVVFESTVYPGLTEEICLPLIEKISGLSCGHDWVIGYSPERINPGDKEHSVDKIIKIVAGMNQRTSNYIDKIYKKIVKAGTFKVSSIKIAEAAKIIENVQRDINIALINELAKLFEKLNLNTYEVLEAAATKWNFLNFRPGLVGGHCIRVDPYYLLHQAETIGCHPQLISVARRINDSMPNFCANQIAKLLSKSGKVLAKSKILIMGATFKENVKDLRNSKIADLIKELQNFQIEVFIFEPNFEFKDLSSQFNLDEKHFFGQLDKNLKIKFDGICYAVDQRNFCQFDLKKLKTFCGPKAIFFDLKGRFVKDNNQKLFNYQSL